MGSRRRVIGHFCQSALWMLPVLIAGEALLAEEAEPAIPGYADEEAFAQQLGELAASPFARVESLGTTLGGREVKLVTVGQGNADAKPALLVLGSVHPPMRVGSELAVRMARRLVDDAEAGGAAAEILERVTVHFIPRPSPDACAAFSRRPFRERTKNLRPMDLDGDGEIDEDGPEDLTGNGWIAQMRVEDPAGEYIPHPADDRVMIRADRTRGERGRYLLFPEGRDLDGDGEQSEDPPGGVAFNRNFTFNYPFFACGAGPHQVSEVETRAVADFAFDRTNLAALFTFTPEDNLMHLWRPSPQSDAARIKTAVHSDDAPYFERLAERYRESIEAEDPPESPAGEGSVSEWAYFHFGRWSLAARGWWIPQVAAGEEGEKEQGDEGQPPKTASGSGDDRGAEELNALRWFAREGIDGFIDWQPVEHPDFPDQKVEVGGFRPYYRWNPPAAELDALAEKHHAFLTELVERLPRLELAELEAEDLGHGVWRITATVSNAGFLPTASRMGEIAREPLPLQAEIELPEGAELVRGHPRVRIRRLLGSGDREEVVWMVHAPSAATVRVRAFSPSVGEVAGAVELTARD